MRTASRRALVTFVAAILLVCLAGQAKAWTVPFPGGDVRWGPGYGGVKFPYGDVRWGRPGGRVDFPGGGVIWGPPGSGKVRINVPGFTRDFRW